MIVEHYTATDSFSSVWNTFAADTPDPELGELPGTCAHFIIDRDGTIYQLVPLTIMCRHTVGLNWTAIGIEHVGTSDQQMLDDPRQLRASLRLTLWLMTRFKISLPNVIGHAESLTSPYHRELYAPWRCQTHADWQHADMVTYRRDLLALREVGARHARCAPAAPSRQPAPNRPRLVSQNWSRPETTRRTEFRRSGRPLVSETSQIQSVTSPANPADGMDKPPDPRSQRRL